MSIEPFSIEDFTTDLPDDEFIPHPSEYNTQEPDMRVTLLHHTPLWVCSIAIRKCWSSEDKSDTVRVLDRESDRFLYPLEMCDTHIEIGPKDKALIERVGNKNKHSSTLEHLNYSFDIDGISRACLQELARHRHASLSVKSSRYTLKELKDSPRDGTIDYRDFLVMTLDSATNEASLKALSLLKERLEAGTSNDLAKYCLPEAYKTSLVWTINARSLQNFLSLRTSKAALWEIRDLAYAIYDQIPTEHQYLFTDSLDKNKKPEPSCTTCKWVKLGGEDENDECHNTSLSAHLNQGTLVADDFCCNRYEEE